VRDIIDIEDLKKVIYKIKMNNNEEEAKWIIYGEV
jgi:hypothetical protein